MGVEARPGRQRDLVDNVVRGGTVVDAGSPDPAVKGARRLYELLGQEPLVSTTVVYTVDTKGSTASRWPW